MLQTVRSVCVLQPNALEIRVSDQIEQLDDLIKLEGDGRAFFSKTHITNGMDALIRSGIARLAGKSNQAIFHLKQAMGGGKTHLLVSGVRHSFCQRGEKRESRMVRRVG